MTRPYNAPYCSSKAALHAITDCMRIEMAPFNIKVVLVAPGFIRTNIFKLGPASWCLRINPACSCFFLSMKSITMITMSTHPPLLASGKTWKAWKCPAPIATTKHMTSHERRWAGRVWAIPTWHLWECLPKGLFGFPLRRGQAGAWYTGINQCWRFLQAGSPHGS